MADALILVGEIYEGFWVDWTRNKILGCTLTLSPTSATILTNSLAMWVTLCSIQLWTIIRYTLHQWVSSYQAEARTPQLSGQQVILRNTGSALTTAHLMLAWAWNTKSSTGQRSVRAYAIAVSAAAYAILFTIAGAVSNHAITAPRMNNGAAVLLRNSRCGVWNQSIYEIVEMGNYSEVAEFGMYVQNEAKKSYELQLSLEYAQECYLSSESTTDLSSTCQTLKQPSINLISDNSTVCPFAPQMCHKDSDTMVFDTGDVDSHIHFGINSVPKDRLRYRRITRCAVLDSTPYVSGWNGTMASISGPRPPPEVAYANYGPSLFQETNWTYAYTNFASFYDAFSAEITTPYQIGVKGAFAPTDQQWLPDDFEPIQELTQETADITLVFLSFTGMYLGQVDDPWFVAGNKHDFNVPRPFLQERYSRDTAISVLGCTEQHRFCTNNDVCTGFLGFNQVQNNKIFNDNLTPHQNATFDRVLRAVEFSRLPYVIKILAMTTTPLLASKSALDGNSGITLSEALPIDQWTRELEYWQSIAMAQMQRTVARWATGQIVAEPGYLVNATDPQDIWFCKSLMVPSASFMSFRVAAIVAIAVSGCLVIFAGIFIERVAALFHRCLRRSTPSRPWDRDDMIELQRRKTVRPHRKSPLMNQYASYCAEVRSSDSARTDDTKLDLSVPRGFGIGSQRVQQWQYARLNRTNPGSGPSMTPQTSPPPSTRTVRESWMTISLCSVDPNTRRMPSSKEVPTEQTLRKEPCLHKTQHASSMIDSRPAPAYHPKWI